MPTNLFCEKSVAFLHSRSFTLTTSSKVSITINQQLENEVTNLKHQFLNESPLLEGALLSNIFPPPGPAQKTLHIVIVRPIARESSPCPSSACLASLLMRFLPNLRLRWLNTQ